MTTKRDRRATKNLSLSEWLTAWWGSVKRDTDDLHFSGPSGPDRTLIYGMLCTRNFDANGNLSQPSIVEELAARGYDVETLEFRIKRKVTP